MMDKKTIGVFRMFGMNDGISLAQVQELMLLAKEHGLDEVVITDNDHSGLLTAGSMACGVVDAKFAADMDLFAATATLCNDFDTLNQDPDDVYYSYRGRQFIMLHE